MTAGLVAVELDDGDDRAPPPKRDQERRVAVFDLLEENNFVLTNGPPGPYRLRLRTAGSRVLFDLRTENDTPAAAFGVSMGPLRQVIKDYDQICESYYEAVKSHSPAEIEQLDEARRSIHAEGARCLIAQMDGRAEIDAHTARRLFTLIRTLTTPV